MDSIAQQMEQLRSLNWQVQQEHGPSLSRVVRQHQIYFQRMSFQHSQHCGQRQVMFQMHILKII